MNRIKGMPDPKVSKTITSCPVWFTAGPHSWATQSDKKRRMTDVCFNCKCTRKDATRPKVKLTLIVGGKA